MIIRTFEKYSYFFRIVHPSIILVRLTTATNPRIYCLDCNELLILGTTPEFKWLESKTYTSRSQKHCENVRSILGSTPSIDMAIPVWYQKIDENFLIYHWYCITNLQGLDTTKDSCKSLFSYCYYVSVKCYSMQLQVSFEPQSLFFRFITSENIFVSPSSLEMEIHLNPIYVPLEFSLIRQLWSSLEYIIPWIHIKFD